MVLAPRSRPSREPGNRRAGREAGHILREAYLIIRAGLATCEKSGTGRKFHLRESRLSRTSSLSRSQFTNDEGRDTLHEERCAARFCDEPS